MSKMTVLQMTQNILSAMDSDVVDTTEDSEEARQIKTIIIETYNELMSRKEWNHLKVPLALEALESDVLEDFPTTFAIPDSVIAIDHVRYDTREADVDPVRWCNLTYLTPECFLDRVLNRNSTADDVDTVGVVGSNINMYVFNDRQPSFWTSFDDKHIVFDAYNADLGDYLPANRTVIYATYLPAFPDDDDDFVPDLPSRMFPMFLSECKKAAFLYLKEMSSPVDEKRAFRGASIFNNGGAKVNVRGSRARFGRRR